MDSLESRLDTLSRINDGWLNGEGKTPTPAALEAAYEFLSSRPFLYPTPDGGLQAEYRFRGLEAILTIEPDGSPSFTVVHP
jgi:hypothetical protein